MIDYFANAVARNLRKPKWGVFGFFVKHHMKRNEILEKKAVLLSDIKPHHNVLEIGFGPGFGMRAAYEQVKDGTGTVNGIDYSEWMVEESRSHLAKEIAAGKIQLTLGSVESMPYAASQFDRVFHCNVYHFWPDIDLAASEIYRVMKPHSKMVTTLCMDSLKNAKKRGFLRNVDVDPLRYMVALETAGFKDINLEEMHQKDYSYQVIYSCVANKKK